MAPLPHKLTDVEIEEPAEIEPAHRQIVMHDHGACACEMIFQNNKSIKCLRRLDLLGPLRRAGGVGTQQAPYQVYFRRVTGLTQETHQIWHKGCHDVRDCADLAAERPQKQVRLE